MRLRDESPCLSRLIDRAVRRVALLADLSRRNADDGRSVRHVGQHHRIRADARVIADRDRPQHFCASAYVDMPAQRRDAAFGRSDRHLLKQQAIGADHGTGMNYDALGVGYQQAAADLRVQRNVGAGDGRRIHTRYDRCAHTFLSTICIATAIFWLNQ